MAEAPSFWYRRRGAAAFALAPAGALYALGAAVRETLARPYRAGVGVVCVGNPTLGGAGKTPTALAVAAALHRMGLAPHFLSRGHGGRLAGPVTVDPESHGAGDVGDEPLLLAAAAPTHIARDRPAGAAHAEAAGAGIIVMDDGFQNPTIAKDLALMVVDGAAGVGNGCVFPAGPLRAPLAGQIARADALVLVGPGAAGAAVAERARQAGIPVLEAALVPDEAARALSGARVYAFSGIGRPEKFLATLRDLGADIAGARAFADHHAFSAADCAAILAEAARLGAVPVTTEKDFVRLDDSNDAGGRLRAATRVVPVRLVFADPGALESLLGRLAGAA